MSVVSSAWWRYQCGMERYNIGRCRSGKVLTSELELDCLASAEEVFDAMAMLEAMVVRLYRRNANVEDYDHLRHQAEVLRSRLESSNQLDE